MQAIYGYDVAADLQPGCRYDQVVAALGGAGETVTDPDDVGAALDHRVAQHATGLPGGLEEVGLLLRGAEPA